jgi:hypothetical protein
MLTMTQNLHSEWMKEWETTCEVRTNIHSTILNYLLGVKKKSWVLNSKHFCTKILYFFFSTYHHLETYPQGFGYLLTTIPLLRSMRYQKSKYYKNKFWWLRILVRYSWVHRISARGFGQKRLQLLLVDPLLIFTDATRQPTRICLLG